MYMGGDFTAKTFAVAAEDAGLDSLWCGDHVRHYVDGIATLGCFAGCTERITIGTNVIVAPFRPAVTIAKGIASAALAAARQVIAGIGVGGEFPVEFDATGANLKTRGAYTDEAIAVMKRVWSGEPVSFHGRFNDFDDFHMQPAVSPAPPVWVGGRADGALRRAATLADGYIPYLVSPAQLARRYARVREFAAGAGRALDEFTYACTIVYVPAADADTALATIMDGRLPMQGLNDAFVRDSFLLGDVARCTRHLAEYVEAGASHIVLGCPPGSADDLAAFMHGAAELRDALSGKAS